MNKQNDALYVLFQKLLIKNDIKGRDLNIKRKSKVKQSFFHNYVCLAKYNLKIQGETIKKLYIYD